MSADPFIQSPENLQSYNRYAYVLNNPLAFTDPSGYFSFKKVFRIAIAVVITVYLGPGASTAFFSGTSFAAAVANGAIAGFLSGAVMSGTLKGAFQGALTGALFSAAGTVGGTGKVAANSFGRYAAHAAAGCVSAVAGGGKCGQGAASAVFGKFTSNAIAGFNGGSKDLYSQIARGVATSVAGGVGAVMTGGKFDSGATTAAYGYLFNEMVNSAAEARAKYGKGTAGHHWVPFGATTGVDISSEARAAWGMATNGEVLPRDVHTFHPEYTGAVRAELTAFAEARGIDLAKMTGAEANEFVQHVRTVDNPAIKPLVARVDTYMERISGFTGGQRIIYRAAVWMGLAATAEQMISVNTAACQANPECR